MPHLKQKSEDSFKSAQLLIESGMYTNSVHCLYYGCLQLIKHLILNEFLTSASTVERAMQSKDSHVWLVEEFCRCWSIDYTKSYSFKQSIEKLKQIRVEADYENKYFRRELAVHAQELSKKIRIILEKAENNG